MMKQLKFAFVIAVILLLTTSSFPLTEQPESIRKEEGQYVESFIEFLSMSPDPHLDQAPSVVINGTSGEFNSSFHISNNETDPSYIELNWTHVRDTPLQFRTDKGISECADFVYFTQAFDWSYNELPLDAELRFNFSTFLTGSFETIYDGKLMSDLRAWLIDSSGNWIHVYDSNLPYIDIFQQRSIELDYFEIAEAWRGMISNSTHHQEDPEDILTLAVGLSPNLRFQSYESSEPWRIYDGSVYVRVSDVDIYVRMELPPDPSTHMEPLFNNTWGMQFNEIFPLADGEADDICYDIETGDDGSVYVVGKTSTGYDYYFVTRNIFYSEVLLKYDSALNLLWKRRNINTTEGYAVCVHKGNVYTAGNIRREGTILDSHITKWSPGGNRIWSAQWGDNNNQEAVAVAVGDDSSVYVLVGDFNWRVPEGTYPDRSAILKYDSAGRFLWNKTVDRALYAPFGDIFVTDSHLVLNYWSNFLSVRDLDGNELWNMTYHGDMTVKSDYLHVTRHGFIAFQIEKWSLDGVNIWNTSYSKYLVIGNYDNLENPQLEVGPDGSVFFLVQGHFTEGHYLTKYNSDGTLNWTKSIGTSDWPRPGQKPPAMDISSWGIAYFTLTPYTNYDFHVYAYQIGAYTLPKPPMILPVPLILGGGGVVVVLAVLVWVYRKRSF